jgi:hypothetical protein
VAGAGAHIVIDVLHDVGLAFPATQRQAVLALATHRKLVAVAVQRLPQLDHDARRRTRTEVRATSIRHERAINETRIAEEHRKHQAWLAATREPPPF